MNRLLRLVLFGFTITTFQACEKQSDIRGELSTDPFTYGHRFDFREDSIKIGDGEWTQIKDGEFFSWLAEETLLDSVSKRSGVTATYPNNKNLQAEIELLVDSEKLFVVGLRNDSLLFRNLTHDIVRDDLYGTIDYSASDTTLMVVNTSVSPQVTIKYILEQ